jgi:predicted RecA/RadA family phage recombinase
MAEAVKYQNASGPLDYTPTAAVTAGEVVQLADGRAGVLSLDLESGKLGAAETSGVFTVTKAADLVWIQGGPIWWDHSANAATPNEPVGAGDRDFYLGTAYDDELAATTSAKVNLNVHPYYIIDSARDNGDTVIVKTVVGSTTVEVPNVIQRGGMLYMNFGTTAEAQKVDWLSGRSFAVGANWVCEILFELIADSDNAAADIDVGVASGTHATDFETITAFAAFHLDDDLNLDAHSDDGTTDKAPTDTTVDVVAGTPVRLTLDGRSLSNVKYYVDGAEVLAAEADLGNISAAVGPLHAIIHAEKTSDDSPLEFRARIRVRTMQEDAQV